METLLFLGGPTSVELLHSEDESVTFAEPVIKRVCQHVNAVEVVTITSNFVDFIADLIFEEDLTLTITHGAGVVDYVYTRHIGSPIDQQSIALPTEVYTLTVTQAGGEIITNQDN